MRIEVIQALSHFEHPQMLDFVKNVAKQDPSRPVRARALEIARQMAARKQTELGDEEALKQAALARSGAGEPKLNALLVTTCNNGASNFHLSVGQPSRPRRWVREILSEAQWERLQKERQLDFCHYIPTAGRCRANVFIDQKGTNGVFRVIPQRPPTIAEIGAARGPRRGGDRRASGHRERLARAHAETGHIVLGTHDSFRFGSQDRPLPAA